MLVLCLAQSAAAQLSITSGKAEAADEEPGRGIIVTRVEPHFDADRAGIKPGDILIDWSAGSSQGTLETPFDLFWLEMEYYPLGPVRVQGLREGREMSWSFGTYIYGIQAMPVLPNDALALCHEANQLAQARKFAAAEQRWRTMVRALDHSPSWMRVWGLYYAADALNQGREWKLADALYGEAAKAAESEKPAIAADIWWQWAVAMHHRDNYALAEQYYREALRWSQRVSSENQVSAAILNNLGLVASQRNSPDMGEEYYQQALAIQEKLAPESTPVSWTMNSLGYVAWHRGDLTKAEEYYSHALVIKNKFAPGKLGVALSLYGLGHVAREKGDLAVAAKYFEQELEIMLHELPDSLDVVSALRDVGLVAQQRGDVARAEHLFRQALTIGQKLAPESLETAWTLEALGSAAWYRSDLALCERYTRQAVNLYEKLIPGSVELANGYGTLGAISFRAGSLPEAQRHFMHALSILQGNQFAGPEYASLLENLADLEMEQGHLASAEAYLRRALENREKVAPAGIQTADILASLGEVLRREGRLPLAEEYLSRAMKIQKASSPETAAYAETLASLAAVKRSQQKTGEAVQLYRDALDALEMQVAKLGGTEQDRAGFRASRASYYRDYIALLAAQNQTEAAFQALERSRARTLLETLAAAHVDVRKGADPDLIAEERSLRADLGAKREHRVRLLNEKRDEAYIRTVEKEISDVTTEYEDVKSRLRANSPNYSGLTQPQPLSPKQVQEQLLDEHTLLLEYSLGEERSFVFVLSPASLQAFELPPRSQIEKSAQQVYRLLTERNRIVAGETEAQRERRWKRAESSYPAVVTALSRMVLGPVSAHLRDRRLLVVPDGALAYIPFSLLPEPAVAWTEGKPILPLMLNHEIVNLPSASVMALLRQQERSRRPAPKSVVVLADPVFDKGDSRIHGGRKPQPPSLVVASATQRMSRVDRASRPLSAGPLSRSANDVGMQRGGGPFLPRLPFSRREADAIMEATPSGAGLKLVDFAARRATVLDPKMAQFRIVHFATHGLLDSVHPELSGLVLSLVDENGRSQDGFVGLDDVYNLNLPAELVVLSACKTGLGKEMNGEGLIGLTRGFMYAGATRVVASLWNVSDAATANLMANFYKAMEQEKMAPAAALRAAQIQMWKQDRWKSPYFWAAFEIQGEWK